MGNAAITSTTTSIWLPRRAWPAGHHDHRGEHGNTPMTATMATTPTTPRMTVFLIDILGHLDESRLLAGLPIIRAARRAADRMGNVGAMKIKILQSACWPIIRDSGLFASRPVNILMILTSDTLRVMH